MPIMGREFSTPPPAGHSMFSLPRLFVRCATLLHPSHPSFVFMHLRTAQFPSLLFSNLYNSGGVYPHAPIQPRERRTMTKHALDSAGCVVYKRGAPEVRRKSPTRTSYGDAWFLRNCQGTVNY